MVKVWDEEHTYVVEGSGYFPFDMLRRDRSFPADSVSASRLATTGKRRITLTAQRARDIAVHRWASFGWRVVAGFVDDYPMAPVDGEPFEMAKHGELC